MVPVGSRCPSPEPCRRKPQDKERVSKIFPGERYGTVHEAGDKCCSLIKETEVKHPCGIAALTCGPWEQEEVLSLQFLITQPLRARDQELPSCVTSQPELLTAACKPVSHLDFWKELGLN